MKNLLRFLAFPHQNRQILRALFSRVYYRMTAVKQLFLVCHLECMMSSLSTAVAIEPQKSQISAIWLSGTPVTGPPIDHPIDSYLTFSVGLIGLLDRRGPRASSSSSLLPSLSSFPLVLHATEFALPLLLSITGGLRNSIKILASRQLLGLGKPRKGVRPTLFRLSCNLRVERGVTSDIIRLWGVFDEEGLWGVLEGPKTSRGVAIISSILGRTGQSSSLTSGLYRYQISVTR